MKNGAILHNHLYKLILASMLAALCCVATMIIQIPSPMNGYINLGDCVVLICGWLLGPYYGTAAAAVGSMLADVFLGYPHYAPGTFLIKGLTALTAFLVFRLLKAGKLNGLFSRIISGICAELIMTAGYFGYASLLLGKGLAAAASIPGNLMQGAVGVVSACILAEAFERFGITEKFFGKHA